MAASVPPPSAIPLVPKLAGNCGMNVGTLVVAEILEEVASEDELSAEWPVAEESKEFLKCSATCALAV